MADASGLVQPARTTTTTTSGGSTGEENKGANAGGTTPTNQVECLGEALAGVSLGKTSPSANYGASAVSSASFALSQSQQDTSSSITRNGSSQENVGWGDYTTTDTATGVAHAASTNGGTNSHEVAFSGESHHNTNGMHSSNLNNESSLHLFLSQDPSRTLGDDVFKLSHPNLPSLEEQQQAQQQQQQAQAQSQGLTSGDAAPAFRLNSHSLAPGGPSKNASFGGTTTSTQQAQQSAASGGAGGSTSGGGGEVRTRRTESPSAATAGTTSSSRSASPYTNGTTNSEVGAAATASRTIQAYQPYDSAQNASSSDDNRSAYSLNHGHPSNPSMVAANAASPYAKPMEGNAAASTIPVGASPYEQNFAPPPPPQPLAIPSMSDPHQQQLQAGAPMPVPQQQQPGQGAPPNNNGQQQAGQVLYMAVPSPDGRGQVLQPVQMVQLPGKQMAYVVPGAGGAGLPGAAATPQQQAQPDTSQSMMVLPPLPSQQQQQQAPPSDPYATSMGAIGSGGGGPNVRNNNNANANQNGLNGGYNNFDMNRNTNYMNDLALGGGGGNDYGRGGGGASAAVAQQFQSDPAVASLYAAPQRPPLDALLGQVRRLSRDQVGCRLVQQALDEEGQMAATLILQEGLPFWGEAMVDPFGNYLFQKILEKVTPDERVMLVKSVSTRLVNASLNLHGTRSVQKVVELCSADEQAGVASKNEDEETAADILTKSLAPAAARLCIDSHGNHVIQRIILKLGSKHSQFVFDAVATSVGDVARHRHGCCVIQRCLDSPPSEARSHLVRRIVEKALELMQDAYGNYVVQYVLDVCSDEDVHAVCESVVGKVNLLAIQKFSSNVMEKCLERCTERVKEMYMSELSDHERIRELMMDPFGNYVVQRALSVATHAQAIRLVEAMRPHLLATQTGGPNGQRNGGVRNTAGGRRIIAKICRRFPNFTLSDVGSQDELYSRNPNNQEELYSRNKGNHRYQGAPPVLAYAPVGAPAMSQQQWLGDANASHYTQGHHLPIQQPQTQQPQSYYNLGGAPTYYDHFGTGGHGGFHGL